MLIKLKNKDTLEFESFKFKCSIGKNGKKKNKKEGDKSTPRGTFELGKIYYRKDRIRNFKTSLKTKIIKSNMGWSNNPGDKNYNKEIIIKKERGYEKLYRKDNKYDLLILIKYNYKKTKKGLGSAIFIHLTKNYNPTAGCIALSKKDFLILIKLIKKKTKIKIY